MVKIRNYNNNPLCCTTHEAIYQYRLTEFDGAVHAEQDVVALDVSMDDLVEVEELQRLQTLKPERR